MSDVQTPAAEKISKLPDRRFKEAGYARTPYMATVLPSVPFEHVLVPEFWSHVARRLRRGDLIEVSSEDDTWWALLRVARATPVDAEVNVLVKTDLAPIARDMKVDLTVFKFDYGGPEKLWRVIRKTDKKELKSGFLDQRSAEDWAVKFQQGKAD